MGGPTSGRRGKERRDQCHMSEGARKMVSSLPRPLDQTKEDRALVARVPTAGGTKPMSVVEAKPRSDEARMIDAEWYDNLEGRPRYLRLLGQRANGTGISQRATTE
jgi:hypothetical protein